ncbi:phosphatase PAP2 family protein [Actinoplanes sp. NPDC026619]|uniref:phosphatase PAP2 family protein n=1 Tax=Actinoplanes sp. NPDC026619 TaxID=3155798 RepID=UPI0034106511
MNFQLFHVINSLAGRWTAVDQLIRFAAVDLIFVAFAVAAIPCVRALRRREIRPLACLGVTLAVAFGLSQALAYASREMRPFQDHPVHQLIPHAPGVSLPSDHATAAFALAFGVWAFQSRRIGLVLTVAAVLIGLARVAAGVHYPGDILAAAIIAALSAFAVHVTELGARDLPPLTVRRGRARN